MAVIGTDEFNSRSSEEDLHDYSSAGIGCGLIKGSINPSECSNSNSGSSSNGGFTQDYY